MDKKNDNDYWMNLAETVFAGIPNPFGLIGLALWILWMFGYFG